MNEPQERMYVQHSDVARGITQAYGHLPEVNLGYVAAPAPSITDTTRAQARTLNVGIIAVEDTDSACVIEPARVTGAGEFSTTIDAVRLQATTHRLTDGSFPVNHPKNYLGYALALLLTTTLTPCTPTTSSMPFLVADAAQSC